MAIDSVGYYALPVIPSLKGAEKTIGAQMRGVFGKSGTDAGKIMGEGVAKGLASSESKTKAAASKHAKALDKVADAGGAARVEITKLNEVIAAGGKGSKLEAQTERVARALRNETTAARDAKRAEMELGNARRTAAATGAGAALGNPLKGAEQGMSQSSGGLASMAGGIGGKVGGAFMAGLGAVASVAAVGMLLKSALDVGIDFEKQVNMFSGVTNSGAAGMDKMRTAARALGTDTQLAGTSASDAAAAMVELAKGGMTADQAMQAARGTLQLATAGQLDAAQAAQIQSSALNIWQLKATDATHVADLLAASANASSADVHDLGLALSQGGNVAAGFGVSIEDTLTALTMFSKWGINGSDAGTMLKTSLQAITDQGKPAQGAIDELGLSLYDAQGKFVGVESMMKQVGDASKHMTQEQFQAATAVLFGSDAMRASMVAANGGAAAWDDVAKAVGRQGAAADMAAANMQGLPGVVESLSNAWEGLKLKIFDVIDGPLIAVGHWFTDALSGGGPEWLHNVGNMFSTLGQAVAEHLMPALKDLWGALKGPLAEYGKQWVATFKEAWPIIKVVGAVIGGVLMAGIKQLSVTLPIVVRVMTAVITVMQGVYAGIKAGAGVFMTVASAIGGAFVGAWHLLQSTISAVWSVISPVWEGIKTGLSALGEAGRYVFDTVLIPMWHNLQTAAGAAWSLLQPIFGFLSSAWDVAAGAATAFWQGAVVPVWAGITGAFSTGWAAISPVFEWIKGAFQSVADVVSSAWSGLAGIVKSAFDGVIGAVKGPLHWLGSILQKVPLKIGPVEIPGAQAAKDLGNSLAGLAAGGVAGRDRNGRLRGPGNGTSDSILGIDAQGRPTALVSAGEGVVKESAMRKGGAQIVAALNRYAGGGTVTGPDVEAALAMAGTGYSQGDRTDCSGMVARVILKALGMDTAGGLMSTKNAESWLAKLGFQSGTGGPGAMTVGWYDRGPNPNDGHMAMTLSNGEHAEAGGANGVFTIGANATGGDDPEFDNHMFLPIEGLYPEGSGGSLSGAMGAGSTGTVPAGSVAGTGPGGESGYYTPESAGKIKEAEARVAEAEAKKREVDADVKAKESQKIAAQNRLDEANAKLDETKKGKFTKFKDGATGADAAGGSDSKLGELGSIGKQFLQDTFGLGDLLPDPSELGIVKLLSAMAGIKYTPQGKGFPWQGGGAAPPDGGLGGGDPISGILGGLLPGVSSLLPAPGDPASGNGLGPPPGPPNIDQSTNVTIQNPQLDEASNANLIRRTILKTPRLGTNSAPQGIGT